MQTVCFNGACVLESGPGGNQCAANADCGPQAFSAGSRSSFAFSFPAIFSQGFFSSTSVAITPLFCGDGQIQPPESCDNGNQNSDTTPGACRTDCSQARCGDFVVDTSLGESCDQGSGNSKTLPDRCRLSCQFPSCGDGIKDAGELCDDGNLRSGDGCSSSCTIETTLIAGNICGDGRLDPGESCDDGNTRPGDGCDDSCYQENAGCSSDAQCPGGVCVNGSCTPCRSNAQCQSGSCVDNVCQIGCASNDQCEGGVCIDGSCTPCADNSECRAGQRCVYGLCKDRAFVASTALCGDGTLSFPEECDDCNLRDRDGCSADCYLERGFCGDGIIQRALGETCEPSLHDKNLPFSCNPVTCRFLSGACGDAKIDSGEECDDGAENNKATPGATCRSDCSFPRCGDRVRDLSESCDDGNRLNGDGCSANCTIEQGAATTIAFPGQESPYGIINPLQFASVPWGQRPWAMLQSIATSRPPVGDTGPAAVAVIASGAAAGFAYMRRKRRR